MPKLILWSADACGYSVRVLAGKQIVDEYVAGNCRQDSQVFLDPDDPAALSEEELREGARSTAVDLARQHSADAVEEDTDFIQS